MKSSYFNAVTCDLVKQMEFIPVKDSGGNFIITDHVRVLSKMHWGSYTIIEMMDGDAFSTHEIKERIQINSRWVEQVDISGTSGSLLYIQVFVFSENPDQLKLQVIKENQDMKSAGKKSMVCVTIEINSKKVIKYSNQLACIGGIEKIFTERLEGDLTGFEMLPNLEMLAKSSDEELDESVLPLKMTATYVFLGINIFVWLLGQFLKLIYGTDYLTEYGVKYTPLIIQGEYWRLITPMFLHANFMHLFANSYSLLIFGQIIERVFGIRKFVIIYLSAGLLGSIASFVFSYAPSLGASGAVLGLGGAYLLIWRRRIPRFLKYSGRNFALVIMVIINVLYGFGNSGIDNYAHIGGVIGGYLTGCTMGVDGDNIKLGGRVATATIFLLLIVTGLMVGFLFWGNVIGQ